MQLSRRGPLQLVVNYQLLGDTGAVRWPAAAANERRDELWKHSCCELFIASAETSANTRGYTEFNWSASGEWAAYEFGGYRKGMRDRSMPVTPAIECQLASAQWQMRVSLHWPTPLHRMAAACIIEPLEGPLSYWALRHPSAKPDFHNAGGFVSVEL
jgi:hypothetical protein